MPITPFGTYETWGSIVSRIRWAENVDALVVAMVTEKLSNSDLSRFERAEAERELERAKYEVSAASKLRDFFDFDGELIVSEKMACGSYGEVNA